MQLQVKKSIEEISDEIVKETLKHFKDKDIDISEYIKAIGEDKIKGKIQRVVSDMFLNKNIKDEDLIINEFKGYIEESKKKKEFIISVYLASLSLSAFAYNKNTEGISEDTFTYIDYLFFVFLLIDLEKDDKPIEFKDLLKKELALLEKRDLFDEIDNIANDIFEDSENENYSSLFALKEYFQKNQDSFLIEWEQKENVNAHHKPLILEKIFY